MAVDMLKKDGCCMVLWLTRHSELSHYPRKEEHGVYKSYKKGKYNSKLLEMFHGNAK